MATLDQTQNFVPIRTDEQTAIHGKLATPHTKGFFVRYKNNSAADNSAKRELEPANGGAGFYLTRNCVAKDENARLAAFVQQTQEHYLNDFVVNESNCSAHKLMEGVFEGTGHLDATVTNALAAGTKLMFKDGKLATVSGAGNESCGEITRQLTPTNGGTVRVHVTFK